MYLLIEHNLSKTGFYVPQVLCHKQELLKRLLIGILVCPGLEPILKR